MKVDGPDDGLPDDGLPVGWSLALDGEARRADQGRALIGGSPLRVLRFTASGARWLDGIAAGHPLPPAPSSRALARRLIDAGLAHPVPPDGGPAPADVAVVIPVRDDAGGLARTLASLAAAGRGSAVGEVIVVDDGSRDPGRVREVAAGATVVRNPRPCGPGAARQRGWRLTSRPVIAFVDAGVEVPPRWLEPLLAHLGDRQVGAAAPRVVASPGVAPASLVAYERSRSPLDMGPRPAPVRPRSRVPYAPTAALLVRREALADVGGFDVDLRHGEDVDLVWRLHDAGWRIRYQPDVEVSHPSRDTLAAAVAQRVGYGLSAAPLWQRHGSAVAPLRISGWSALGWAAVFLRRPLLGAGIGVATTTALGPRLRGLEHPVREAVQIAGRGNVWAGSSIARAVRRSWWPPALVMAVAWPRVRPALVAAVVGPAVLDRRMRPSGLGRLRFAGFGLADDVAYGAGVWLGCLRHRCVGALLPASTGPLRSTAAD